jgi:hypothetical protein
MVRLSAQYVCTIFIFNLLYSAFFPYAINPGLEPSRQEIYNEVSNVFQSSE